MIILWFKVFKKSFVLWLLLDASEEQCCSKVC